MRFPSKISVWVLGLLAWGRGWAQEEVPPLHLDLAYASNYVFRGVERAGDSAQAALELNRGNFRGGLWVNQPFDSGDMRELSLSAAYAWRPADTLTMEAAVAHTWFDDVPGDGVKRSLEAGLSATLAPVEGFAPGLAYYHDFHLRADTVQASLARSIALTKLGAFLELNFFAGWVNGKDWRPDAPGPRRSDGYGYWGGEAHVPYRVGPHSTVVTGLHYADSFGRSVTNGPFGRTGHAKLGITLGVNLDF